MVREQASGSNLLRHREVVSLVKGLSLTFIDSVAEHVASSFGYNLQIEGSSYEASVCYVSTYMRRQRPISNYSISVNECVSGQARKIAKALPQ